MHFIVFDRLFKHIMLFTNPVYDAHTMLANEWRMTSDNRFNNVVVF